MPEQPRVHPPVDLLADALDQALGHGRVVARAEIAMRRRRGLDFFPDAHVTLQRDRPASVCRHATRRPARNTLGLTPGSRLMLAPGGPHRCTLSCWETREVPVIPSPQTSQ